MIGDSEMAADYKTRKFTVDEYHAMVDAGILREDERVELIDGEIVEVPPIGPEHRGGHARLTKLFVMRFGDRATVVPHGSTRLSNVSEPEPDMMVLRPREDFYTGKRFVEPDDIIGLAEVSDSSLAFDRIRKARLYAAAGVREYWILNLRDLRLEVHRHPHGVGYATVFVPSKDETIGFEAMPEVTFRIGELFG